jgi:co-chaperonin GroES (HSP10)
MYVTETDDDKRLITCTVVSGNDEYKKDDVVVTGRYSTYQLSYKGTDYLFLDVEDVIGTISENV